MVTRRPSSFRGTIRKGRKPAQRPKTRSTKSKRRGARKTETKRITGRFGQPKFITVIKGGRGGRGRGGRGGRRVGRIPTPPRGTGGRKVGRRPRSELPRTKRPVTSIPVAITRPIRRPTRRPTKTRKPVRRPIRKEGQLLPVFTRPISRGTLGVDPIGTRPILRAGARLGARRQRQEARGAVLPPDQLGFFSGRAGSGFIRNVRREQRQTSFGRIRNIRDEENIRRSRLGADFDIFNV